MSAKELAITLLGLVGTYCLPWPAGTQEPAPIAAIAQDSDCSHATDEARAFAHEAESTYAMRVAGTVRTRMVH